MLLAKQGLEIYAVTRNLQSDISDISSFDNVHILHCELSEIEELLFPTNLEDAVFFHLAWNSSASKILEKGIKGQMESVLNSVKCLKVAKKIGCQKFVAVGSVSENLALKLPLPDFVNIFYAVSKDYTNKVLSIYARDLDIDYIWCRLSSVYGPEDNTGHLISYAISTLLKGESPTFSEALQPYSFIHVLDCAAALTAVGALPSPSGLSGASVYIGGSEIMAVKEFMGVIGRIVDPGIPLKFGIRPDDGARYKQDWFDTSLLKEQTGVVPQISFVRGITDIVNDIKKCSN